MESHLMVKLKITADLPRAVVREGADELTLRREEEGTQRTFGGRGCTPSSMPPLWETVDGRPLLVDEDEHAICQAIYKGVEGPEWVVMYNMYVEMHRTVARLNKKEQGYYDPSSELQIESRAPKRYKHCGKHT